LTSTALVRPRAAIFWDLRGAWASGRRVALSLDADVPRAEGFVTKVSATDSNVHVGDLLVPADRILAVHLPSRLGDSTVRAGDPWAGTPRRVRPLQGQTELRMEG
jgi:hypothetical protein